jgi:HEAT repeat protein
MNYPDAVARDRAIKQCLSAVGTLPDLQRVVMLGEWRESCPDEPAGVVDRANQALAAEWFTNSLKKLLHQDDSSAVAGALDLLAHLTAEVEASGEGTPLLQAFAPELADLVIEGPPSLRGTAARILARSNPSIYIAVPALDELCQATEAELRLAAAEALAQLIQNALRAGGDSGGLAARPAPRRELVLTASSVLPSVHRGLDDPHPEVRRRCLEALGLACVSLSRLMETPAPPAGSASEEAPSPPRSLDAQREELRPLVLALRDQGPMLARCQEDSDLPARLLAHRALEELGLARQRWLKCCLSSGASVERPEDEMLRDVLQQGVPGLVRSLEHPDVRVRRGALDALEVLGPLALPALPALTRALQDPDRFVRWSAVRSIGNLDLPDTREVLPDLTRLLHDPDLDLRRAATTALTRLNANQSAHR